MNNATKLALSLLFPFSLFGQGVTGVYKIDALLKRISSPDTVYVVNFWATWCKPCVSEIPAFDSLELKYRSKKVKVLLVALDFSEDLESKVNPFIRKNRLQAECVLLDEVNGNTFVNRISKSWSGAIPATYFRKGSRKKLIEKKLTLRELEYHISSLKKK